MQWPELQDFNPSSYFYVVNTGVHYYLLLHPRVLVLCVVLFCVGINCMYLLVPPTLQLLPNGC